MKVINISRADEGYTHKNWFYKNIYVNFSMIYYIIDGTAYYNDEKGTILLKKNHIYIFPVKKTFTLYDNPNNQLYHTYIHATTSPSINSLIEIDVENTPFLKDTISLLRKYISTADYNLVANFVNLILYYIFAEKAIKSNTKNPIAIELKKYIDENINKKINLENLNKKFSYSKAHLNRIFKKKFNKSPIEYYNDKRLELSIKYLLENKSSKDISIMLNYATPAAYSNAFKMKYGLSPCRYMETIEKINN